jgi:hypothetical protein
LDEIMTTKYTQYFRLALPDFRMGPWHDLINEDLIRIDELLYGLDGQGGDALSAIDIIFNSTITNLPAANVQEALDYLHTYIKDVEASIDGLEEWIDSVWASARKVPVAFPFTGKPTADIQINVPIAMPVSIAANLAGSVVYSGTQATDDTIFTVNRVTGATVVELGTITITSVSHTSCVLSGPGGSLAIGDVLQIKTPTADATLADVGISILTLRV